ncbi:MAG: DUF2997 domain-containing protein [Candidatus Methanofastidiosum sp.]|jgi:hypothetical protein|nr:DUF2997 domain-containing protein [Methanofastidiosum sp.]
MQEYKITVTIDNNGGIEAETKGFKGEACIDALEELLKDISEIHEIDKTDDYNKKVVQGEKNYITIKRG